MKKFSIKGLAAVLGAAIFAGAKSQTGKPVKRISKPQNTETETAFIQGFWRGGKSIQMENYGCGGLPSPYDKPFNTANSNVMLYAGTGN